MHDLSRGRIVVTGGAGLIGSAIIWALNRRGIDDILVVDRLDTTEKWKNLVPLRFADYLDADDFELHILDDAGAFADVRAIFHLGACSSTTEADADYLIRNNYEYTKRLAGWAIERGVRMVYASSAATYGALEANLSDECELATLRPLNMYAYSKHLFDLYAARNGWSDSLCGVKYFNIFGPNEQHKADMRSIVHKAFGQIVTGGSIRLFKSYRPEFADGEQERDFLYVKDAAEMTVHLAQSGTGGLVNVGSGTPHTWLELVRPIFRAMGVTERIEFIDMPESLRGKYQYSTCARIERIRESGYDASITPLDQAVTEYVTDYLIPDRRLDERTPAAAIPQRSA
ncbi:MAG: ADP-glyceromanno-heptose 6-epimerase [Candidatus Eremiobacteraeota bacterium]|nr:ADP-glyceromanno-heptose 6-epimerase [Candidatus Eremiobacteraeota bacterium]